jgi:hypothetical protein
VGWAGTVLVRVVGDVEAAALELESRSGEKAYYFAAATFVHLDRSVREPLENFKNFVAFLALIFVKRHR